MRKPWAGASNRSAALAGFHSRLAAALAEVLAGRGITADEAEQQSDLEWQLLQSVARVNAGVPFHAVYDRKRIQELAVRVLRAREELGSRAGDA